MLIFWNFSQICNFTKIFVHFQKYFIKITIWKNPSQYHNEYLLRYFIISFHTKRYFFEIGSFFDIVTNFRFASQIGQICSFLIFLTIFESKICIFQFIMKLLHINTFPKHWKQFYKFRKIGRKILLLLLEIQVFATFHTNRKFLLLLLEIQVFATLHTKS